MTGPVVATTAGLVQTLALGDDGVRATVPFAAPPVGPRRFRPPEPAEPWNMTLDGTSFGAAPPQPAPPGGATLLTSEDCLTLNIWTPSTSGRHPVLVWVYGGGFEGGAASPPFFDGERFMRRTGCVVVAPQYRTGALGWLDAASLGPAWEGSVNLGLQDLVAALHWVRSEIRAFGGDSASVTLAGESAGAFCVGAVLAMPSAHGLFKRAVLQSGSTTRVLPRERSASIAHDLCTAVGAGGGAGLVDISVDALLAAQRAFIDQDIGRRNTPGGRIWGVVHDGMVLPDDPQDAARSGGFADVTLLVGANRDEARMWEVLFSSEGFAPADEHALLSELRHCVSADAEALLRAYRSRSTEAPASLARLRSTFLSDWIYRAPAVRLARDHTASGGTTYTYLFEGTPFGPELGAFHAAELALLFDSLDRGLGPLLAPEPTEALLSLRDQMMDAWGSFVRTGNPGWRSFNPEEPSTRRFSTIGDGGSLLVTEPPADVAAVFARAMFRT